MLRDSSSNRRLRVLRPWVWPLLRPPLCLAALVSALGVGLALSPDRLVALASLPERWRLASSPGSAGLEGMAPAELLSRLASADQAWIPRAEHLGDGRMRYVYRRRQGDPELSLDEIRAQIAQPPSFGREQAVIVDLLQLLTRVGVRVQLTTPRKPGAAGEWEAGSRSLRLKPQLLDSGSRDFAMVLNHEVIHVAQSCRNGGVSARPRPLGLPDRLPSRLQRVLSEAPYRRASALDQRLEREAYANQQRLDLGARLLRSLCLPIRAAA